MQDSQQQTEELWVIWNGSLGILDTVTIGQIEASRSGRQAWLEEPYDMVGPFSLDELEAKGSIDFAACTVMSRQKWQNDQVELRREAHKNRRAAQERLFESQARYNQRRYHEDRRFYSSPPQEQNDKQHRELLNLPIDGELQPIQIKTAFRKLAQKTHPDVGGSHEQFVKITHARNALLRRSK